MSLYLLRLQKDELWCKQKEQYKQNFIKSTQGFLHLKPRKREINRFDKFKDVEFSIKKRSDGRKHSLDGFKMWDILLEYGSLKQLDGMYDIVYDLYIGGYIISQQWCAYENLYDCRYYQIYN